jgi:hypothetical protein
MFLSIGRRVRRIAVAGMREMHARSIAACGCYRRAGAPESTKKAPAVSAEGPTLRLRAMATRRATFSPDTEANIDNDIYERERDHA